MNKILIFFLSLTPFAWGMVGDDLMKGLSASGSAEKTAGNPRTRSFYLRKYVLMRDTVGVASQDGAQGSEQAALVQITSSGAHTPHAMATFANLGNLSVGVLPNASTALGTALKALLSLRLSGLSMASLPNLSWLENLQRLDVSSNNLESLSNLPPNLKVLRAAYNKLTRLPNPLPATLKELDVQGNDIAVLEPYELPANLEKLNIAGNNLSYIFRLPPKIQECDASYNQLQELPTLEHGRRDLRQLNLRGNCIKTMPLEFVCAIARNPQLLLDLRANPLAAECAAKLAAAGYSQAEQRKTYAKLATFWGQYSYTQQLLQFNRGDQVVLLSGDRAPDGILDYVEQCTLRNVHPNAAVAVISALCSRSLREGILREMPSAEIVIWDVDKCDGKALDHVSMRGEGSGRMYELPWQ